MYVLMCGPKQCPTWGFITLVLKNVLLGSQSIYLRLFFFDYFEINKENLQEFVIWISEKNYEVSFLISEIKWKELILSGR